MYTTNHLRSIFASIDLLGVYPLGKPPLVHPREQPAVSLEAEDQFRYRYRSGSSLSPCEKGEHHSCYFGLTVTLARK